MFFLNNVKTIVELDEKCKKKCFIFKGSEGKKITFYCNELLLLWQSICLFLYNYFQKGDIFGQHDASERKHSN